MLYVCSLLFHFPEKIVSNSNSNTRKVWMLPKFRDRRFHLYNEIQRIFITKTCPPSSCAYGKNRVIHTAAWLASIMLGILWYFFFMSMKYVTKIHKLVTIPPLATHNVHTSNTLMMWGVGAKSTDVWTLSSIQSSPSSSSGQLGSGQNGSSGNSLKSGYSLHHDWLQKDDISVLFVWWV